MFTARRYANPGGRRLRPMTDTYTGPGTGCLPYRLGITDPTVLVAVEPERAHGCEVLLCRERPDLRRFHLDHLRGLPR